jgi:hypothetical protein
MSASVHIIVNPMTGNTESSLPAVNQREIQEQIFYARIHNIESPLVGMPFEEALIIWMRAHAEISEVEAMADLFYFGFRNNKTYRASVDRKKAADDYENGVITHPDQLKGARVWMLEECNAHSFRIIIRTATSMTIGFVDRSVYRVAKELRLLGEPWNPHP